MAIAYIPPFPYMVLFAIVLIVAAVALFMLPSMRSPRKPRNLLVYLFLLLILSFLAYQAYDASLGVAAVTYDLDTDGNSQYYAEQVSQLNIICENLGIRELNFYLTITATNASLTVGDQQNYVQVNSTTVKIPFHFDARSIHTKQTQPVYFVINENAAQFKLDFGCPIIMTSGAVGVQGQWSGETSSYTVWGKPGPCVL